MKNISFTVFLFIAVTSCGVNPKSTTPSNGVNSPPNKANKAICKMIGEISVCSDKLSNETTKECFGKVENLFNVVKSASVQEITSEQKQKWGSFTNSYILCIDDIYLVNTTPSSLLNGIKQCLKNYQSNLSKIFHCE